MSVPGKLDCQIIHSSRKSVSRSVTSPGLAGSSTILSSGEGDGAGVLIRETQGEGNAEAGKRVEKGKEEENLQEGRKTTTHPNAQRR